jgi:hypothetical protein
MMPSNGPAAQIPVHSFFIAIAGVAAFCRTESCRIDLTISTLCGGCGGSVNGGRASMHFCHSKLGPYRVVARD